jgi:hypothetical protein
MGAVCSNGLPPEKRQQFASRVSFLSDHWLPRPHTLGGVDYKSPARACQPGLDADMAASSRAEGCENEAAYHHLWGYLACNVLTALPRCQAHTSEHVRVSEIRSPLHKCG